MIKGTKLQRHRLLIVILIISALYGSFNQINGHPLTTNTIPVQIYQVASPLTVYQSDQLNASVSVTNTYFEDIINITISGEIPSDLEFLFSSEPDLDSTIENDSEEFEHHFGSLLTNEILLFSITYNVTSSGTKQIELPSMNISFQLQNGIDGYLLSNGVTVFLKGEREFTTTTTLPPLPKGTIQAPLFLIAAGYMLPIVVFGLSVLIMRRFRKK
jgi:hypothetical protein